MSEIISQHVYTVFSDLWTDEQLQIICLLFKEIKKNKYSKSYYMQAIDAILQSKDDTVNRMIKKTTDSI